MDQLGEIVSPRMWTKGVELEHEYNDKHNFVFFFFFSLSPTSIRHVFIHPVAITCKIIPQSEKKKKKNISCESL